MINAEGSRKTRRRSPRARHHAERRAKVYVESGPLLRTCTTPRPKLSDPSIFGGARMGPIFAIMDLCSTVHPQKAQMMHKILHSPSLLILTGLFRRGRRGSDRENPKHNHPIANIRIIIQISKVCRRARPVRIIVSCWITWCLSSC